MYGVSSQAGFIDSYVNSDSSGYNWQQQSGNGCCPDTSIQNYSQYYQPAWNRGQGFPNGIYAQQVQHSVQDSSPTCTRDASRTPEGRPPHTVVAFGFGGTLAVIRQCTAGSAVEVHELTSFVKPSPALELKKNSSKAEIFKWIEERSRNSAWEEQSNTLPLLWRVLKIALDHHGMLRSEGSTINGPDAVIGQLILSASARTREVSTPEQIEATAQKVNGFLLCGKRQQALQCAHDGKMWGMALVLAAQLGQGFYADTVSKMTTCELAPGPSRTYTLLANGNDEELFNSYKNPTSGNLTEDWHLTLALMATNRRIGDQARITRLGDNLWESNGEVVAAHLCYLLADQPQIFFRDGRMYLIGADHCTQPRTFVSPLAIKRTELYELAKMMGNPQFILDRFQPYKIVYANMLAEAGQQAEALRYCQDVLKTLKAVHDSSLDVCIRAAADLEKRLQISLEGVKDSYSMAAGRILSSTFGYVKNSFPTTTLTRHNSASMHPAEVASVAKAPYRSISEPDLSTNASSATPSSSPGLLRRVGSNVYQKAASFVIKSKHQPESSDEEENLFVQSVSEAPQSSVVPRKGDGLYVQCTDYLSRSSQLVKSLVSPQLPPIFRSKQTASPRLEV